MDCPRLYKQVIYMITTELPYIYPQLQLQNHCYRRIAYDNAVTWRWDKVITSPFIDHVDNDILEKVIHNLLLYSKDKSILINHNDISLTYRNFKS